MTWTFSVIDTTNKRLPADLAGRAFDDPEVISRFNAMMDWAKTQMPDVTFTSMSIGNEVDIYLNANTAEWPAWRQFYSQTVAHARQLWPDVEMGCKATFNGMVGSNADDLSEMNRSSDTLLVTYYPGDMDFNVPVTIDVAGDFARMVEIASGLPVRILEIGLSTSAVLGSSELKQADFFTDSFTAWDTNRTTIKQMDIFALHDFNPVVVTTLLDYYGLTSNSRFGEFLGHLGLRTFDDLGDDKLGWTRVLAEISARQS